MLQWRGKPAADHIPKHIENNDIRIFEHMMLLKQLHRLPNNIAAAASSRGWAASLYAFHAVISRRNIIFGAKFFRVKIHAFENINHRGLQRTSQGKGAVMLRITANLQHPLSHFGKGRREVRRGR